MYGGGLCMDDILYYLTVVDLLGVRGGGVCALCMDDLLYYLTVVDLLGGAGGGGCKKLAFVLSNTWCVPRANS